MKFRNIFRRANPRRFQRRSRAPRSTSLRLESLENRTLLAGDVTAAISGQSAIINGDGLDNSVELAIENGDVVVRGLGNTTINGSTDTFVLIAGATGIRRDLRISLGSGNDTVNVNGLSIGRNVVIHAGNGNDQIGVSNGTSISRHLIVNGGYGNDTVSLQDSSVSRNTVMRGQNGDDLLIASSATIGRHLVVSGGRGSDDIVVDDSTIGRDARLRGWSGNDDIVLRNTTVGDDLTAIGHSGADVVMIDTSIVGDRTRIAGRRGSDNIVIEGDSQFRGRSWIHGGRGGDNLQTSATATFGRSRSRSFSGSTADASVDTRITDAATGAIATAAAAVATFDPTSEQQLTLSVSTATVAEDAGAGAATLTVSRSTATDEALTVTVTSSDTSRLTLQQATVTIAAGATSGTVLLDAVDNTAVDGNATVTIDATAANFANATQTVTVTDDDATNSGSATLSASASQVLEDTGDATSVGSPNSVNFNLTLPEVAVTDETFDLVYLFDDGSDASNAVSGPASITVPANQSVFSFSASTVANDVVEADRIVVVSVQQNGTEIVKEEFSVLDNDSPRLILSVDQSSVTEDGPPATITITRNTATAADLTVTLSVSDASRATINGQSSLAVQIPAGQISVTQELTAVDDTLDNGDTQVTVTAIAAGSTAGDVDLQVIDNDAAQLTLVLDGGTNIVDEDAGADAISATLERNSGDISAALTVNLAITDDSRLTGPASITIPAGQDSVDISFDTVDNNTVDSTSTSGATVTASASGFIDATTTISITDDEIATFQITPDVIVVDEDAGTGQLQLTRNTSAEAQEVTFSFDSNTLINAPSSATFPVGANTLNVPFTIIDNDSFDANVDINILATSPNNPDVTAILRVANDEQLTLTTDFTSNTTVESVEALVTKAENFTITGQTNPGATVQVDTNGNAAFDEGTTVADTTGNYSITVPLTHTDANDGLNRVQVRAVLSGSGVITTSDITSVHRAVGTLVRFETNQDVDADGTNDFYDIELLDTDAPIAVANFLSYVNDGSYDNNIVHRSPPGFVIQGGGFAVNSSVVTRIPTRAAITGEFSAENSNVRGTLSMAHSGSPDSGTSQWFVNVVDNVPSLDDNGHTVFGRVIGGGMTVVDAINSISVADLSLVTSQSALTQTPIANSPFLALSGTVALTANSSTLVGSGTQFTTELQVGDVIDIAGSQVIIASITSDTELTIDVQANTNQASLQLSLVSPPPDTDYLIFTNIGELLDSV